MSIIIKGKTKPEDCPVCPLAHWDLSGAFTGCEVTVRHFSMEVLETPGPPSFCPLEDLPPHGRLIDVDALPQGRVEWEDIVDAPTIIEADDTVKTPLFDIVEEHANCHVQVLRNSITGEISVGWWEEKE